MSTLNTESTEPAPTETAAGAPPDVLAAPVAPTAAPTITAEEEAVAEASKLLLATEELLPAEAPAPAAPSAPSTITTQITTTAPLAATTTAPPTGAAPAAPMGNTATAPLDNTAAMLQPQQQPPAATTAYNPNLTNLIDCPHPIDVLMPVGGYQLWAGNRRYRMLVELRRPEFRAAQSQQEQARIALDIVRTIQKEGGRFLAAIETPANSSTNSTTTAPGIVRTTVWRVLPETDVLTQLGAALRDEQGRARKRRRQQRRARRRERRRQRRAARQAAVESAAAGGGGTGAASNAAVKGASAAAAGTNPEESLPAGNSALQSLYYVPSYLPKGAEHDDGSISSSTSSSSSEEESLEEPLPLQPPKKKGRGGKKIASAAVAAVAGNGGPTIKNQPKVNFHYKPKPTKSHKAVLEQEGEGELPKGVTVRPSGKWQAQTYFAGQSRYVGVYDTSRLAARAYVVVQDYLRQYRENRSFTKETPKEELARIFAAARKAADDAVSELRKEDALTGTAGADHSATAAAAAVAAAAAAVGPTTKI